MVVSHDEGLLDAACSSIAECRAGRVELYKSHSHAQWKVERAERARVSYQLHMPCTPAYFHFPLLTLIPLAPATSLTSPLNTTMIPLQVMAVTYEANQREMARLQAYVNRFGAKTMGAAKGQEYLRQIEKLKKSSPPPPPPPPGDGGSPAEGRLCFPVPPRGSKRLLELRHVDLVWAALDPHGLTHANKGPVTPRSAVVADVCLSIERGMRIVVRGPNGAGKSTVLGALSGVLPVACGQRSEGEGLKLGAFTQDLAQDLDQVLLIPTRTHLGVVHLGRHCSRLKLTDPLPVHPLV